MFTEAVINNVRIIDALVNTNSAMSMLSTYNNVEQTAERVRDPAVYNKSLQSNWCCCS